MPHPTNMICAWIMPCEKATAHFFSAGPFIVFLYHVAVVHHISISRATAAHLKCVSGASTRMIQQWYLYWLHQQPKKSLPPCHFFPPIKVSIEQSHFFETNPFQWCWCCERDVGARSLHIFLRIFPPQFWSIEKVIRNGVVGQDLFSTMLSNAMLNVVLKFVQLCKQSFI